MIKNVRVKKILKGSIFRGITLINKMIPKNDNIILLYMGNKGLGFNLSVLYRYLLDNNYNEKYKIICAVESKKYFGQNEKNVEYVDHIGGLKWFLKTSHVFYTAGQLPIKPSKEQIVIHMNHGTSDLKAMGALTNINNGDEFFFTYLLVPSVEYKPVIAKAYQCPVENILVCGEPMTDVLFSTNNYSYDLGEYDKTILWLPTFRQSDYLSYDDSQESLLPMFEPWEYDELNRRLKELNIQLIVKIHPAQNCDDINRNQYSHLKIMTNEDFVEKGYELYNLMRQVDGLIGDYSSASLQFLLVDRPNAFVVPDFEEYREKRGFCFKNPIDYMPGPIIKEKKQLFDFLLDMSNDIDNFKQDRERVRNLVFKYQDGNNTERVLKLSKIHR